MTGRAFSGPSGSRSPLGHSREVPQKDLISWVLRFDNLPQDLPLFRREVCTLVLAKREKHQKLARRWVPKVDHSRTSPLPPARGHPTKLSEAARPRNGASRGRPPDEMWLQTSILLIGQEVIDPRSEGARLNDHHPRTLRQWRIAVKFDRSASRIGVQRRAERA